MDLPTTFGLALMLDRTCLYHIDHRESWGVAA
jgi:hypothetical protein